MISETEAKVPRNLSPFMVKMVAEKSNFVTCIDLLRKSIESFQMVGETERIMEIAKEKDIPQELLEMLLNSTSILKYKRKLQND